MLTSAGDGARRGWDAAPTLDVQGTLEKALRERYGAVCRVTRLERRRSDYASSFGLEELDVVLADGRQFQLIFKDVGSTALLSGARAAKPNFLRDPRREVEVYDAVLSGLKLGTAECYAAVSDEKRGRFWLLLERVPAVELYQVGELETWRTVARWLAVAHARLGESRLTRRARSSLLCYDANFFRVWAHRARAFASPTSRPAVEWVVERYERVIELLTSLPVTTVHGDFYASNILVASLSDCVRVCPIDWEMAGIGPALLDLAALTAGSWSDGERAAIVRAYRDAATGGTAWTASADAFNRALDCCRLHIAVQWLGWSAEWSPPAAQRQDWLGEALRVAARLSP